MLIEAKSFMVRRIAIEERRREIKVGVLGRRTLM